MAEKKRQNATLEDVRILYRNFSGKEGQYNAKGQRNFCVILPPDVADAMAADGYNIKSLKPRDEDEEPGRYVKVNVNFDSEWPPQVVMITSRGRTTLGEDEVDILDWANISNTDLIFSPNVRTWPDGKTTVTAYLHKIFVTIEEDALELKYANVPDSAQNTMRVDTPATASGPRFYEED